MKTFFKLTALAFFVLASFSSHAQQDEGNKIQMVVTREGKSVTVELSTAAFGISRYRDYAAEPDPSAASKEKSVLTGNYYISVTVKKVNKDFLKTIANKDATFSGVITMTDTYGKNPPREIKFTNAYMESYSDQFNAGYYEDSYATAAMSFSTKGITLDGVVIE